MAVHVKTPDLLAFLRGAEAHMIELAIRGPSGEHLLDRGAEGQD